MANPEELDQGTEELRARAKKSKADRLFMKSVLWVISLTMRVQGDHVIKGMLEGSIVDADLTYPDKDNGWLTHKRAPGGRWVGHDFRRQETFPRAAEKGKLEHVRQGRLVSFILDEIVDNEPEELTALGIFKVQNLDHLLALNTTSPGKLVEQGLMALRTYGEAYDRMGLYGEYGEELKQRGVVDSPVFQVTPKGNTLVHIFEDSGSHKPQEEREKALQWLPGYLRPI